MKNVVKMASILLALMLVASCSDLLLDEEVDAAKPEIVVQPLNVNTNENNGYTLSVEARSTDGGNLYYEWFRATKADMSDAVSAGTLPEVTVAHPDSGIYYYYCKITNKNEGWSVSGKTTEQVKTDVVVVAVADGYYGYTVEHYQQNPYDDGYSLVIADTELKSGMKNTLTEAQAKQYAGFTARDINQQPVSKDGNSVVKVYYDRNVHTLSFDGIEMEPLTFRYGSTIELPVCKESDSYLFDGWYTSQDYSGERVLSIETGDLDDDMTVYAKWLTYRLAGSSEQKQGDVIKEYIEIDGIKLDKTGEVVVIPAGMEAYIYYRDNSSWDKILPGTSNERNKGVFLKDRKVRLSAFAMGQYEVTGELFYRVMKNSYEDGKKPARNMTWFELIIFCNKLSLMEGLEPVYSLIINGEKETDYLKWPSYESKNYEAKEIWANLQADITKNGYRLPTEAEREYAARGGNPDSEEWMYRYSGSNNISEVAQNSGTNEVGLKKCNRLNLYDMSGNVCEWCFDIVTRDDDEDITIDDDYYMVDGYVTNPMGRREGIYRCLRGGDRDSWCIVTKRDGNDPYQGMTHYGFRLVRSLTD